LFLDCSVLSVTVIDLQGRHEKAELYVPFIGHSV
jgi:hypothetical protein